MKDLNIHLEKQYYRDVLIYKGSLKELEVDNSKIIQESNLQWNRFFPDVHNMKKLGYKGPGVQFPCDRMIDSYISSVINKISKTGLDLYQSLTNKRPRLSIIRPWMFISTKYNTNTKFHNHNIFAPEFFPSGPEIVSYFTSVYYVNVPEIVEESILYVKDKAETPDSEALKIYPEVGDLYYFSADAPHMPVLPVKSKNTRYVLAMNFYFGDENISDKEPKQKLL